MLYFQFNRFARPDLRKSLFNKFLRNRPGLKKPGDKAEQDQEEEAGKDGQQDDGQDYDSENTGMQYFFYSSSESDLFLYKTIKIRQDENSFARRRKNPQTAYTYIYNLYDNDIKIR